MQNVIRRSGLAILFFALMACTNTTEGTNDSPPPPPPTNSETQPIDSDKLCDLVTQCSADSTFTLEECRSTYEAAKFPAACADKFPDATTCADLNEELLDVCFPPCTGASTTCNGDGTITSCLDNGRSYTFDCALVCELKTNKSWSGECGTSYGGETSETAKCWCT